MAHLVEQRQLPMQDLYAANLVSIFVGPQKREFKVPRGLICSLSAYFCKAFDPEWIEGKQGSIDLEDAEEWIVECFVGWLYTNGLSRQTMTSSKDKTQESAIEATTNDQSGIHDQVEKGHGNADEKEEEEEEDPPPERQNPVSWSYRDLVDLYCFADYYDTKGLRRATMEAIQLKYRQYKPVAYLPPTVIDMSAAFRKLSDTSPLYEHFFKILVGEQNVVDPVDSAEMAQELNLLPRAILVAFTVKIMQLAKLRECRTCSKGILCDEVAHMQAKAFEADEDRCKFHEHETEESRLLCQEKWKHLEKKHDFGGF